MDRSKVGVVFFKIENFHTLVSINLNPLYRGKKLAATLLRNAMHDAQKMSPNIDHFVAEIKDTNTASIKVFYQNGFTLNSKKDHSGIYSVQSSRFGVKTDVSNIIYTLVKGVYPNDPKKNNYTKLKRKIWPIFSNPHR